VSTPLPFIAPATPPTPEPAAGEADARFSMAIRLKEHYAQVVDFDLTAVTPMIVDETAPLGWEEGPNPARLLGAAVGSCLGASLLFCLRKARVDVSDLRTTVDGTRVRNARGRLRIGSLRVRLHPSVPAADRERMARCLGLFEDFCIVTESVRHGIDVDVEVEPTTVP
jgi:organic hydroperoxide reductase OsmC/OhrA